MLLRNYNSLVFDCDGVLLNSNKIKTDAFYKVTETYGKNKAKELVNFHIMNGGVSRQEKFKHFFSHIVPTNNINTYVDIAVQDYGVLVKKDLQNAEVTKNLEDLHKKFSDNRKWMVVSGGNEEELNDVFKHIGIFNMFDGGIFGNPKPKHYLLQREINNNNIILPSLYIGDSKYDYEVSISLGLDFCFVSNWTEFKEWKDFFFDKDVYIIETVSDLLSGRLSMYSASI